MWTRGFIAVPEERNSPSRMDLTPRSPRVLFGSLLIVFTVLVDFIDGRYVPLTVV
jgi:hypothetical protein